MYVIVLEPKHTTDDPAHALSELAIWRKEYPDAVLTEVLIDGSDPRTAIPGELGRAIDAWNDLAPRMKVAQVGKPDRYVKSYRTWKCAIGSRPYMLEQLIPAIEAQPFLYSGSFAFTFAWLFGQKNGEWKSDKVWARAYGNGNGGADPQKQYLDLARRVGAWERECGGLYQGSDPRAYAEAFERGTKISLAMWEALRKQHNGKATTT